MRAPVALISFLTLAVAVACGNGDPGGGLDIGTGSSSSGEGGDAGGGNTSTTSSGTTSSTGGSGGQGSGGETGSGGDGGTLSPGLTWVGDVHPLLVANHCVDCHDDDQPDANYSLTSYAGALGGGTDGTPNVIAGSANSRLVQKCLQGHKNITSTDANVVRTWVVDWQAQQN